MVFLKKFLTVILLVACWEGPLPVTSQDSITFQSSETNDVNQILQDMFGVEDKVTTRTSPSRSSNCIIDQKSGQCVLISQCPQYIPLLREIRNPNIVKLEVVAFFRSRICRLETNQVFICCINDHQGSITPSRNSGSQTQNSRPSLNFGSTSRLEPPSNQPVPISFGGSIQSQRRPIPSRPLQNRPLQPLPQNRPVQVTTTIPRISLQNTQGSFSHVPSSSRDPLVPSLVSIPICRQPTLSAQNPPGQKEVLQVDTTQVSQTDVIFTSAALHQDRLSNDQSQDSLQSLPGFTSVNLIPSERECGSIVHLENPRNNVLSHWPWLAAVGYISAGGTFEVVCGGAVITKRHVIIAAHCMKFNGDGGEKPNHVRLGDYDLGRNDDLSKPQSFIITGYTPISLSDIAIIRLSQNIVFDDFIQPVCLPYRFRYDGFRYQSVSVIGWRETVLTKGQGKVQQTPAKFEAPVLPHSKCHSSYPNPPSYVDISRKSLCTSGNLHNDCVRDSSALAIYFDDYTTKRYFLVGIGSHGFNCVGEKPLVHTRIGAFLDSIEEFIGGENNASGAL